jgi:hypothetical protein
VVDVNDGIPYTKEDIEEMKLEAQRSNTMKKAAIFTATWSMCLVMGGSMLFNLPLVLIGACGLTVAVGIAALGAYTYGR